MSEVISFRLSDPQVLDRLCRGSDRGTFLRSLIKAEDARVKKRIDDGAPICSDPAHANAVVFLQRLVDAAGCKTEEQIETLILAFVRAFEILDAGKRGKAKPGSEQPFDDPNIPMAVPGTGAVPKGGDPQTGRSMDSSFLRTLLRGKPSANLEKLVEPTETERHNR